MQKTMNAIASNKGDWWDDDRDYDLVIRVQADKTLEEFEASLSAILSPIEIKNHQFSLGSIVCRVGVPEQPAPKFPDIPEEEYTFVIIVPVVTWLI